MAHKTHQLCQTAEDTNCTQQTAEGMVQDINDNHYRFNHKTQQRMSPGQQKHTARNDLDYKQNMHNSVGVSKKWVTNHGANNDHC